MDGELCKMFQPEVLDFGSVCCYGGRRRGRGGGSCIIGGRFWVVVYVFFVVVVCFSVVVVCCSCCCLGEYLGIIAVRSRTVSIIIMFGNNIDIIEYYCFKLSC